MLNAFKDYLNRAKTSDGQVPEHFSLLLKLANSLNSESDHIKFRGASQNNLVQVSVNTTMTPRHVKVNMSSIIKMENLTPETAQILETMSLMIEEAFLEAYTNAQSKIVNMIESHYPDFTEDNNKSGATKVV